MGAILGDVALVESDEPDEISALGTNDSGPEIRLAYALARRVTRLFMIWASDCTSAVLTVWMSIKNKSVSGEAEL